MADLVWLIPAFPLAGFLTILLFGRRLGDPKAGYLATATVFALRGFKSRKSGLPCDSGCGCSSVSPTDQRPPATVLQARKGQPSRLRIKT